MFRKHLLPAILVLSTISCIQKEIPINSQTIKFDVESGGSSFALSSIADSVHYIELESKEESLFANVDKMKRDSDGNFYILDKAGINGIIVFNSKGNFLYKINKNGKGPGEYANLSDFNLFNDKLIEIYDNATGKIITYDTQGDYLKETQYEKGYNEFYHIKDTLGFLTSCGGYCPDLSIIINNKKEQFFQSKYKDFLYDPGYFFTNGEQQFVTTTFDNKIYKIRNGQPKEYIAIDFGGKAISTDLSPQKILDQYPHGINVINSSHKNLYFTYTYNGSMINAYHNFLTKESYSGSSIDNDINYIPIGMPVYSEGRTIITTFTIDPDPSQEKDIVDYVATLATNERNKFSQLVELYKNIPLMGKQVLVFYNLK